jgi:threonine dehydrogenase-like Zn-dependent dehydrogenase
VDYNSSSVVDDIKAIGSFQYAYDAIGDASATTSSQVLASGGHLISCATSPGYKPPREDIKFDSVFTGGAYLTQGVELQKLCEYAQVVRGLLESGKLQPLNVKRLEGLASVVQGLELLEQGKVSAAKVVVVPEQ